ncbi:AraC family transcriptional regulator [Streptomyces sp. S3(2020)]|uniref:helix-turn-helix domain-containing protein n=1 Tax=Streptomyces sp. S3(2020) TaxID=2732044 RepID=UPI0019D277AF
MGEVPVTLDNGLIYFTDGLVAAAGHHVHAQMHPVHTHSFVEIMFVVGGEGTQISQLGSHRLSVGDVMVLRPGAWHGMEDCKDLEVVNCCFGAELLRHELAWTRHDPLLGYLLWDGPYAPGQQGILGLHLESEALGDCVMHLDSIEALQTAPSSRYHADKIGRIAVVLGQLARAADTARDDGRRPSGPTHPAVIEAIRLLETHVAHQWTIGELADDLHLAPNYLIRLFKTATGLPPMAYLAHHRAECAAVLLARTDKPIAQIGAAVGWPDQNYFARRFKSLYGLSPGNYRKSGITLPGAHDGTRSER